MTRPEICIFCQKPHTTTTVEHIIPRSLGNLHYILSKGIVCQQCNNKFSKYENNVISSPLFLGERKRFNVLRHNHNYQETKLSSIAFQKYLLKMGYEALYKSRRKIWKRTDFTQLLFFLNEGKTDTIFELSPGLKNRNFKRIPDWLNNFRLQRNHIWLQYAIEREKLYFRFRFGQIASCIRLA